MKSEMETKIKADSGSCLKILKTFAAWLLYSVIHSDACLQRLIHHQDWRISNEVL
jgi:hypothetical protein